MKQRKSKITVTLAELANRLEAELDGDGSIEITGAAPIEKADQGDITFIANPRYLKFLDSTKASAIVIDKAVPRGHVAALRHPNPYLIFARIIDILYPEQPEVAAGVDATAVVGANCRISPTAGIGPLCHIGDGVTVGDNCRLLSSVYIGANVTVGNNCLIYPHVSIMDDCQVGNNVIIHASTVVGSDGFGYAPSDRGMKKIKQIGWVEIGDDVEIGSNCSLDRGALGPTKIGRGTKIDNLVQIAHNVEIGEHCIIVSQVGISGSTKIGNRVILAGQVGIVGHIEIGDGVQVAAQSGVPHSIPAGKTYFGYPAREIGETKRINAALTRLPELLKRVKKIEDNLPE